MTQGQGRLSSETLYSEALSRKKERLKELLHTQPCLPLPGGLVVRIQSSHQLTLVLHYQSPSSHQLTLVLHYQSPSTEMIQEVHPSVEEEC